MTLEKENIQQESELWHKFTTFIADTGADVLADSLDDTMQALVRYNDCRPGKIADQHYHLQTIRNFLLQLS